MTCGAADGRTVQQIVSGEQGSVKASVMLFVPGCHGQYEGR